MTKTNEIIFSIEEDCDFKIDDSYYRYEGYVITTSERRIVAGIDSSHQCCEDSGYLTTHDDTTEFIGATLLDIRITDSILQTRKLLELPYKDAAIFITFITDRGDFQLVVYNEHNGYYSHKVVVQSNQLDLEDWL